MNTVIKGKLEAYFETGTEGVVWSVYEDDKEGYDGLHPLRNGDYLTVFNPTDNTVVWEGNINLEYERNYLTYPLNPQYGQQAVHGLWVHGFQDNVVPEDWGTWFLKAYPAELIKSEFGHFYPVKSSTISSCSYSGQRSYKKDMLDVPGRLVIKFKNNGFYSYDDVPVDVFDKFYESESKGKAFAQHIRDKFVTEKLELPGSAKYSTNPPRAWKKYPDTHGADVPAAWPFPTYDKP